MSDKSKRQTVTVPLHPYAITTDKLRINQWAKEDRPRERLMKHGVKALTNAELLAILIGSGSANESAVDLMKRLMNDCGDNLNTLGKMSVQQLCVYKGIGEAKAITLIAACELGRRRQVAEVLEGKRFDCSITIYEYLRPCIAELSEETAQVLLLNNALKLIECVQLSSGGLTETAMDVRVVMRHALLRNATTIVLAHNHPSGRMHPSRQDDEVTAQIAAACKTMRIRLLDHLIVTERGYYSYADEGKI